MKYIELVRSNARKFTGDEATMWASVEQVSRLLDEVEELSPALYWAFMREAHELMFGGHFDEMYARWQVERMHHTHDGRKVKGQHWSPEQTAEVFDKYRGKVPSEYNEWDFYVALNAHWHDTICTARKHFPDDLEADIYVIDEAVAVWLNDEDWAKHNKVWAYFKAKNEADD